MGIQEEREAFEAWYCRNHTGLKQSDLAKFRTLSGYSFSDSLKINISWEAWQAAKAQAVPEGFVLVPKEIPKSFDEGLYFYSNSISVVNEHSDGFIPMSDIDHSEIWKLVIEAQEPTND